MLTAPLDTGSFDKKLQDPRTLLLLPYFSGGRNCRTLVQSNSVLPFFDKEIKKATLKHTCLFGMLRPWLPWSETAGPLPFACLACSLRFALFSLNALSANPTKQSNAIWFCFSLMRHHSFSNFLSILFVFFVTNNSLDCCINEFCGNDDNELFL